MDLRHAAAVTAAVGALVLSACSGGGASNGPTSTTGITQVTDASSGPTTPSMTGPPPSGLPVGLQRVEDLDSPVAMAIRPADPAMYVGEQAASWSRSATTWWIRRPCST